MVLKKINTLSDLSNVQVNKLSQRPHIETIEKGEILKQYVSVADNIKVNDNAAYMIFPHEKDSRYVRAIRIGQYDKIYCINEDELYEVERKLNELDYKTRIGRNCDTGTLSIAILEEPERENI